ncbi:glycogen/starch/alpha-glucan phosphorylase [Desulforhabdus amnigena]|jgi:starch phosphorylase|uniref:Alpha-1,4 glucan phosphorylase n=1 Tax=Desulforhabdus amnigena TaxID=40218 RepID=A0A9W6D0H2_9BACT|nr:glycogen/starch/alpha-glucan phosphorylase [Desulforhabdus amnigena]GLI33772.1 alpha-1,4 glucan phosphorylase [Desulforhabdus amnigena]
MVKRFEARQSAADVCVGGRSDMSLEGLRRTFREHVFYTQGRFPMGASRNDLYMALAYTVRDQLLHRWIRTVEQLGREDIKIVSYLSAEFLLGPHLENNLINLGLYEDVRRTAEEEGLDIQVLFDQEEEPGLGNGGLGRLAACYLDSLATLEIPAMGYGIRYEFGIFDQEIRDGWQVEHTDQWLRLGNPWEIARPEITYHVNFGGRTEPYEDEQGRYRVRWIPYRTVKGVAYDTPILGYRVNTCNLLRLWKAEAVESFEFEAFNVGDYYGAVDQKIYSENITKVLYPNDEPIQGKQLRLEQQYFFVSCSLQDMVRIYKLLGGDLSRFSSHFAIQLNDTHPAIGVAELMRLLVDENGMDWEPAWEVTCNTFGYTNHTLLPEALEKWPVDLFAGLFPRHMEIIYEINRRFLDEVRNRFPGDEDRVARMSLIDESGERYVRMAHLACVGSHAVNGVAELHTRLLKEEVLRDFYEMMPEKFNNKTNGVTPRRFVVLSNPGLSRLITGKIGETWVSRPEELRRLEKFVDDPAFREEWRRVKLENKKNLARLIRERTGIEVDPSSMFDIQVKRLHEYKRQHLNVLHIIALYNRIKQDPAYDVCPRTFIFGGKAAPGYFMAKRIIKLINSVADVVNHDSDVNGRLKVVFFPDFNVKNAKFIYPAADLSEQISTAGKEASGTGNMKFSMNGALTIGTLDGANVEIREEVGAENFFLFGLTAEDVTSLQKNGYQPMEYYRSNPELQAVIERISSGYFSNGDQELFSPLVDSLLFHDTFMLLADFGAYMDAQRQVEEAYRDQERWTRMSILNVARMGKFSSDRAIREYCKDIWKVEPVPVTLE